MKGIILSLISILFFTGCAKTTLNSTIDNNTTEEVKEEVVNIEEELKTLETECNNGNADSCSSLADIYYFGKYSVVKNEAKAIELNEKACNLGNILS